jgi:hypothetical protein
MSSGWKVYLVVDIWVICVVKNKEPGSLSICENSNSIAKTLDRLPKQFCNSDKIVLSSRGIADVDPEYSPKTVIVSYSTEKFSEAE